MPASARPAAASAAAPVTACSTGVRPSCPRRIAPAWMQPPWTSRLRTQVTPRRPPLPGTPRVPVSWSRPAPTRVPVRRVRLVRDAWLQATVSTRRWRPLRRPATLAVHRLARRVGRMGWPRRRMPAMVQRGCMREPMLRPTPTPRPRSLAGVMRDVVPTAAPRVVRQGRAAAAVSMPTTPRMPRPARPVGPTAMPGAARCRRRQVPHALPTLRRCSRSWRGTAARRGGPPRHPHRCRSR